MDTQFLLLTHPMYRMHPIFFPLRMRKMGTYIERVHCLVAFAPSRLISLRFLEPRIARPRHGRNIDYDSSFSFRQKMKGARAWAG